jgi:cystathionine beta-lyase
VREPGFDTIVTHAAEDPSRYFGAVAPPLFQNSLFASPDAETFAHRSRHHPEVYDYTRVANPTTDILESKIALLEKTEAARCFGSGMAAVSAAILHAVKAGDHVVAVETIYGPTKLFLTSYLSRFNVEVTFVRGTDPREFADACRPNTKLFYLESPSTFVFHLQDLAAISALARERSVITAIDNSWASPYFQNPAEFGIDLIIHSATKYLGGHSDIVAGVVAGPKRHIGPLSEKEGALLGGILDPFAAWLMLRGLRTLSIRLERHQQSAMRVASFLEQHPKVARVFYPGLPSHPQYELAKRQMRGTSGLLSVELKEGGQEAACAFVDRLKYFHIACSWGGYESLAIAIPFPHATGGKEEGMPGCGWGARLHVGLETVEDLVEDLSQALE